MRWPRSNGDGRAEVTHWAKGANEKARRCRAGFVQKNEWERRHSHAGIRRRSTTKFETLRPRICHSGIGRSCPNHGKGTRLQHVTWQRTHAPLQPGAIATLMWCAWNPRPLSPEPRNAGRRSVRNSSDAVPGAQDGGGAVQCPPPTAGPALWMNGGLASQTTAISAKIIQPMM